jgi:hypothetical protein
MNEYEQLVRAINDVIRRQNLSDHISSLEQQKQLQSHIYREAASYTNLVVIAGYAGIFGLWQVNKEYMGESAATWTALLLALSIFLFAGFEVFKMIHSALHFRRLAKVVDSEIAPELRPQVWQKIMEHYTKIESNWWPVVLIPTVISGFGAGLILLVAIVAHLLCH